MAEGHVALHVGDDDGLDVVVVFAAGGGVADVADRDVPLAQAVEGRAVKDLADEAVALEMTEDAVAGNRDAAAFLAPVLEGVQAEIHIPGDRPFPRGPDSEYTALLVHNTTPNKKSKGTQPAPLPYTESIARAGTAVQDVLCFPAVFSGGKRKREGPGRAGIIETKGKA